MLRGVYVVQIQWVVVWVNVMRGVPVRVVIYPRKGVQSRKKSGEAEESSKTKTRKKACVRCGGDDICKAERGTVCSSANKAAPGAHAHAPRPKHRGTPEKKRRSVLAFACSRRYGGTAGGCWVNGWCLASERRWASSELPASMGALIALALACGLIRRPLPSSPRRQAAASVRGGMIFLVVVVVAGR